MPTLTLQQTEGSTLLDDSKPLSDQVFSKPLEEIPSSNEVSIKGMNNQANDSHKPIGIALLIPVTSSSAFTNLSELIASFASTTASCSPDNFEFGFFFSLPAHASLEKVKLDDLLSKHLLDTKICYSMMVNKETEICSRARSLRDLAKMASDFNYLVVLRDDVKFKSKGWVEATINEFDNVAQETGNPLGFACLALLDENFPGFPSLPVVHKSLIDMFGGSLFPAYLSYNLLLEGPTEAKADPISDDSPEAFLFECFFRFRSARIVHGVRTTRIPKKRTQKDALLRSRLLSRFLKPALEMLSKFSINKAPFGALDVVTPSFRAATDVLERILSLPSPDDCVVRFNLICDNPESKEAVQTFQELEKKNEFNCAVRIRMNPVNVGPGGTRNHGLAESCADYLVFLDDDVLVEPNILKEYWSLAKANPMCAGFIGRTVLPPPATPRQFAIKFAGIAYFWDIASQTTRDLPWGITANLCVKREPDIFFYGNEVFTRGGGGEDVDFCMRLDTLYRGRDEKSRSFAPAPSALVQHPYWNSGQCFLKQFFGWTKGDSALSEIHPKHGFRSFPDFSESVAFATILLGALMLLDLVHMGKALSFLLAYIVSDWVYEMISHSELIPKWGLPFTMLVGLETCIVRTWSEIGRFKGQMERGTLLQGLMRRFDWFQENWPEYRRVERTRAFKRGLFRLAFGVGIMMVLTG